MNGRLIRHIFSIFQLSTIAVAARIRGDHSESSPVRVHAQALGVGHFGGDEEWFSIFRSLAEELALAWRAAGNSHHKAGIVHHDIMDVAIIFGAMFQRLSQFARTEVKDQDGRNPDDGTAIFRNSSTTCHRRAGPIEGDALDPPDVLQSGK